MATLTGPVHAGEQTHSPAVHLPFSRQSRSLVHAAAPRCTQHSSSSSAAASIGHESDVPQGDGAAQYGEEGDDDEEDEEDEDDDDDDDEAEEDEGGEDGDRGGEGEVEVKPDSVIWFNLSGVQRQAAQELQYTREAWDNCTRTEVTDQEYWHQLTDEQRAAAEVRWLADRLDPSRTCAPQPRTKSRGRGHARTWRPTAATNRSMWIIWLGPSANCCSCGVFTIAGAWLPERDMAQVEGAEIRR